MHRIDGPAAGPGGTFTEGDPSVGTLATVVTDDWANAVQEELCTLITGAGIALSKPSNAQVLAAIQALLAARVPAGAVQAFAMGVAPAGWLKCYGQNVSRTVYASLFAAIGTTWGSGDGSTTFTLPEMRGEFLRGWDDARGADPGRAMASSQLDAIQNILAEISFVSGGGQAGAGAFAADGASRDRIDSGVSGTAPGFTFNASRIVRTADQTRPRNVAVLWCIRT